MPDLKKQNANTGSLREPVCWFDATTLMRLQQVGPVGLSRVEANVLKGAAERPNSNYQYCKYNRYLNGFDEIEAEKINDLLSNYGLNAPKTFNGKGKSASLFSAARGIEKQVRFAVRRAAARTRRWFARSHGGDFQPGDCLVISGSTWDAIDYVELQDLVNRGVKIVAILADMIPWKFPHQFHDPEPVAMFLKFAHFLAQHASLVVCISEATQSDFLEFADEVGVSQPPTQVMILGADTPAAPKQPAGFPDDLLSRKFVLSVSTIQVRKNHQLLYQIWRRFAEEKRGDIPRLLLVGSNGWLTDDLRTQLAIDPLVRDSIIVANKVNDEALSWLYENCEFTVYPSLYEGWGLPIVESFYHGKACVASNTSSMPEAGQGLAMHLDPLDFVGWKDTISRLINDSQFLQSQQQRVQQAFKPRPWSAFADEFLNCVDAIVHPQASDIGKAA